MTTIWQEDGGRWRATSPIGFPSEQALHDLVAEAPDLLPLAGSPRLAVVGREVALSSGYPDLIAVELTGRIVVIEVKLAANAEARRAVIAQTLGYAASIQGLSIDEFEHDVLGGPLSRLGHADLIAAARSVDQEDVVDAEEFRAAVAENLESGAFRLVLVLDETPVELVRLAGYLERMTAGLLLDLVTVSAFEVGGRRILVPQRIDPVQRVSEEPSPARTSVRRAEAVPVEGSGAFAERIDVCPDTVREAHHRLLRWARQLEEEGVARLWSTVGLTQDVLQVRVPGEQVGMVTLWRGDQGPAVSLWPTVFERRAPAAYAALQALLPSDTLRKSVRHVTDELLDLLTAAYREAATSA